MQHAAGTPQPQPDWREVMRAIPCTFSWTQSRQLINAFYGLGTAWEALNRKQRLVCLRMYHAWLRRSVEIHKPFIDVLNHIQIELLKRQKAEGQTPELKSSLRLSVQGIAAGLRTTG